MVCMSLDINRVTIKKTKLDVLGDEKPKKEHQETTTVEKPKKEHQETVFQENPVKTEEKVKKAGDENDLIPLFVVTGLVTYLVTKYV